MPVSYTHLRKEDVLVIPSIAIQSIWERKAVQIMNWLTPMDKKVIILGISDWTKTEVISWLNLWEEILLKEYIAPKNTNKVAPEDWRITAEKSTRWLGVGWSNGWWFSRPWPVSYTHLDVYKRQVIHSTTQL